MSTATVAFRPRWNQPTLTSTVLKAVVLAVTIVIMVYPFLYVIATSFAAPPGEAGAFSLDAYASVLSGGIVLRSLLVSIGITVVGTLLSVVLTVLLAYGLMNTREVPGGRVILYLVLFTMLFGAGIIPNYLLVKELGL
ncbi:MAG TPA: carbohydrate ABC transporter permease, partial [Microlunatus sp.]|nr:carbohydrate ABC transporter permease [Microlunatus sp.]